MAFDGKQIRSGTIVGAKLVNLTITDAQLAANAVTTAKISNSAVDANKLASDSVIEAKIASGAVSSAKLADSAVTTVKLDQTVGSEAVTTATIRDSAVITAKIADSAVTGDKLAADSVDGSKLADDSVSLSKLAADSVDSSKIVDGSITGTDIASNTVAAANLVTTYENGLLYRDGSRAMSGALDLGTANKITNLADPTQAQDAATKAYVDSVTSGLDLKASVRVATTEDIALDNTTTELDGITLGDNDRVLAKNQATASQNGIWVVSTTGAWARANDANTSAEVTSGLFTFVEEGTVNAGTGWVLTTSGTITLGTTGLAFTQFSAAGSYLAGFGLVLTGNSFAVDFNNSDAVVTTVNATKAAGVSNLLARADHSHDLADNAVSTAKIQDAAVTRAKIDVGLATGSTDGFLSAADKTNIDAWAAGTDSGILAGATADISVNSRKIVNLADPTGMQDAATRAYVDAQVSGGATGNDFTNKNMTASVTTADGDEACATGMAHDAKGYVQVFVNGIKANLTGDLTGDCYFSADGSTARALDAVVASDKLYWNGSIAEYQLAASDLVDFDYSYTVVSP